MITWQIVIKDEMSLAGDSLVSLLNVVTSDWRDSLVRVYHLEGSFDPRSIQRSIGSSAVPVTVFASLIRGKVQIDWATLLVARDSSLDLPKQVGRGLVPTLVDGLVLVRAVDGTFMDVATNNSAMREKIVNAYPSGRISEVAEGDIEWPE
jgi:hypothetical protein